MFLGEITSNIFKFFFLKTKIENQLVKIQIACTCSPISISENVLKIGPNMN